VTLAKYRGVLLGIVAAVLAAMFAVGVIAIARELGVPAWGYPLAVVAAFVLVSGIAAKLIERRLPGHAGTTAAFLLPLDVWEPLSTEDALAAWERVGAYPQGGTLDRAWTIPDTHVQRFAGTDATAEPFALLVGPPETFTAPSPVWVCGPFLRAVRDADGRTHRSLGIFERLDIQWDRLPERLSDEHVRWFGADSGHQFLGAWWGRGTPTARVDFQARDGTAIVAMRHVPDAPEPLYLIGAFLVYSRTLYPMDEVPHSAGVPSPT
jgi:hypothetical protein